MHITPQAIPSLTLTKLLNIFGIQCLIILKNDSLMCDICCSHDLYCHVWLVYFCLGTTTGMFQLFFVGLEYAKSRNFVEIQSNSDCRHVVWSPSLDYNDNWNCWLLTFTSSGVASITQHRGTSYAHRMCCYSICSVAEFVYRDYTRYPSKKGCQLIIDARYSKYLQCISCLGSCLFATLSSSWSQQHSIPGWFGIWVCLANKDFSLVGGDFGTKKEW